MKFLIAVWNIILFRNKSKKKCFLCNVLKSKREDQLLFLDFWSLLDKNSSFSKMNANLKINFLDKLYVKIYYYIINNNVL